MSKETYWNKQKQLWADKEPKVIKEPLETWTGGNSNGYFSPYKNEIHILRAESLEQKVLIHEHIHASRQNKVTFKLASISAIPGINQILFAISIILAWYALITGDNILSLFPCFFVAALFLLFAGCNSYEEWQATSQTARACKELKKVVS